MAALVLPIDAWLLILSYTPDAASFKDLGSASKELALLRKAGELEGTKQRLRWRYLISEERAVLEGHIREVSCCAFSPNGAHVVTASNDMTAHIWDAETGAVLRTLEGHDSSVFCCAYSPDGARVVTSSNNRTARIWDA